MKKENNHEKRKKNPAGFCPICQILLTNSFTKEVKKVRVTTPAAHLLSLIIFLDTKYKIKPINPRAPI